jgi:hypothetical protein
LTVLKEFRGLQGQAGGMYQTYELYLREHAGGEPRFEPLTCHSAVQAMRKARDLLEADKAIASVEVRLAGVHLFTLDR